MLVQAGRDFPVHVDRFIRHGSALDSWEATVIGKMPMPAADSAVLRLPDGQELGCVLPAPSFSSSSPGRWTGQLVSSASSS